MTKLASFSTFLTALIASISLVIPTEVNSLETRENTVVALKSAANFSEQTAKLNNNLEFDTSTQLNFTKDSDTQKFSKKIVGLLALGIGTGVIYHQLSKNNSFTLFNFTRQNKTTLLLDRVSPKLRQKLLRLVHNPQTANRLLTGTMLSHNNRSPNWLAEKVIYDLERDRR